MTTPNRSKERLTVFVAAGAGIPLGIASTQQVTTAIRQLDNDTKYWKSQQPLFETLFKLLNREYIGNNGSGQITMETNFEHMLHALEVLESIDRTRNYQNHNSKAIEFVLTNGILHNDIASRLNGNPTQFDWPITIFYQRLFSLFDEGSKNAQSMRKWNKYQEFWSELRKRYELDIITTNYDTCIEQALPDIDQGFRPISGDIESRQRINPWAMVPSGPSKLAHLHGSILFGQNHGKDYRLDRWEDLLLYPNIDSARLANSKGARSQYINQSGRECRIGFSITGLQKADKVLSAEPYASYYHYLISALRANKKLLIIGYGFADHHINSIMCRLPALHGDERKVVCIDRGPQTPLEATTHGQELFTWPDSLKGHEAMVLLADMRDHRSSDPLSESQSPGRPWKSTSGTTCVFTDGFLHTEGQVDKVLDFLG